MILKRILVFVLLSFSAISVAFTPTPEQIEQFSKLPKAQQEALARQYGFDMSSLSNSTDKNKDSDSFKSSIRPRNGEEGDAEKQKDEFDPTEEPLTPFGYELFSGEPTSFAPTEIASVPSDYIIGHGDSVSVNLYGKESTTHTLFVDNEGRLTIPDFSPVQVAGLTYDELKKLIANKIAKEAIGLNVFVSMAELRSMRVMVVGEAYKPGSYTVSPLSTVTHALYVSGGLTEIASLRNIQVKRAGKTVATLDLYDLLLNGDTSGDVSLRSGDVVFIPSVGPQVSVEGAVKREGIFELTAKDDKDSLVKMFGGFKENAFTKRVQVRRVFNGTKNLAVSADFSSEDSEFAPQGGDHYVVQSVNDEVVDSVTLIGAVVRPGLYEWQSGMTVDQLLSNLKSDLLPQADYSYALVVREKSILGDVEVIQFSLAEALKSKNMPLQKNDEIYIFSRFELRETEEQALANLALTEEQKIQQQKVKLWHLFEYQEFKNKVQTFDDVVQIELEKAELLEVDLEPQDGQYATFSRTELLKPLLKRLEFQASSSDKSATIEVIGQVRFPGVYPLAKNATVGKAIDAAGGVLESAYAQRAELTRFINQNDQQFKHIQVNIDELEALDMKLQSRDTLNILMQPNWLNGYKVTVEGEVRFPGTYTVSRGETLQDVIKRAGGLSEYAEPKAAVFTRESIKEQEQLQLAKLSDELRKDIASKSFQNSIGMNNSISYDEMNMLLKDLASVKAVGRLVIDLPNILDNKDSVVLQDGDALYVPGKQDSISIIGEVNYASSHLFKSGVTIDQYLELSGGVKDRAKEDQIYVIKANGAVFIPNSSSWFAVSNEHELGPGDTIVVPMDASHMDNLTLWSTATQIFYQLGVGVAAIARI
ncbi:SLBB domain-containing protein [Pseudoalteromonas sp. Of7M-16]|uniref:polysaccharide biosynthesis/export family protein n=1 Tax=Pseudoalteromonas sp. Of7M-16 TaxID=2917756 RepID=UPI001EF74703|nr:SLBB domain-containing protein [Pseudoalteromonas sp. Of7M-16]MCG7547233.1 SLBB domain-containing protein [Pseudoalteromonas sp. Of7M-16]